MTLILAVEPDPRQAARLSSVLRGRRDTEVVIAKSAETAIESIVGRVPDVLLTSPLLSPQNETRLADWLKDLGPAATHVRALTIPIFAPKATQEKPPRGFLSSLRRRSKQGPHGCEPKMFADQVSAYLEQGLVERMDDVMPEVRPLREVSLPEAGSVAEVRAEAVAAVGYETQPMPAATPEPDRVPEPTLPEAVETEVVVAAPSAVEKDQDPEQGLAASMGDVMPDLQAPTEVQPVSGAMPELDALPQPPMSETVLTEVVFSAPSATSEDQGLWLLTRSPRVIEFNNETTNEELDTLPAEFLPSMPAIQILTLPSDVVPMTPLEVVFEPPEVITIRDDGFDAATMRLADAAAQPLVVSGEAEPYTMPPVQDEWGFFDPSKCGFTALLAKLDEITDEGRQINSDAESSVRVVTHY